MPISSVVLGLQPAAEEIAVQLEGVSTAIAALPATPLEADLPDIVQIVANLTTQAEALQSIVTQILSVISTTRINQ